MDHSDILAQLKQKFTSLAGDLPKIPSQKLAQILGEKGPPSAREEMMLHQRIILILFATTLLCEKLGVPLKSKIVGIKKDLNTVASKSSISLLRIAAEVIDALPADPQIDVILQVFAPDVAAILLAPQLLEQDLLGKLYQEFNVRSLAKPLNMNFTRWESGFILVGCALSLVNSKWGCLEESDKRSEDFTILDPACGTGGLLLHSYHFFRQFRPSTKAQTNKDRYIGLDVVPLAIDLLSTSWNLLVDAKDVSRGLFHVLPLGSGKLGSLDLLDPSSPAYDHTGLRKPVQLVVMNPPFSRSSGSNTAFGTLPVADQQSLGRRLKELRKHLAYGNVGPAGQAADFMLLAHQLLEPGGRLAAVLPISCLFGAAWAPVRRLLAEQFHVEVIFTHPEAGQCNFSDKTHLSECMLVARKHPRFQLDDTTTLLVQVRHLSEARRDLPGIIETIFNSYQQQVPGLVLEQHGIAISSIDAARLSVFSWSWGPIFRFASPPLNAFISQVFEWRALFFSAAESCAIKLRRLESLGTIAHDRAAYRALKETSRTKIPGNYDLRPFPGDPSVIIPDSLPAFWGRQNVTLTRWTVHPNAMLVKRPNLTVDQFTRHLASRAHCLLPETLRLNTSSLFALYSPLGVVSNVFWGFLPRADLTTTDRSPISPTEIAKITTLWANTTLGLLVFLAIADETDENLLHWKKQTLSNALLPDLETLTRQQITELCALFDRYALMDYKKSMQQRIAEPENSSLDSELFRICLDPQDWAQYQSQILENLEELYRLGKSIFYFE